MLPTNPANLENLMNSSSFNREDAFLVLLRKWQLSFNKIGDYVQDMSKIKESLIPSKITADVSIQVVKILRQIGIAIFYQAQEVKNKQNAWQLHILSSELLQLTIILCKQMRVNSIDFAETLNCLGINYLHYAQIFSNESCYLYSQKAAECFWKAIQMAEKYYEGEPNKRSGLYYGNLGMVYDTENEKDKAILCCKKSYKIQKSTYVNNLNHPDVVRPLFNLAAMCQDIKKYQEKTQKYFIKYLNCRDDDAGYEDRIGDAVNYLADYIFYNSNHDDYKTAIKLCKGFLATDVIKQYISGQKQDNTINKAIVRCVAYMRGVLCRWYHICFCKENNNEYIDKIERSFQEIVNEKMGSLHAYQQQINTRVEYSVYLYQQNKFAMAISNLIIALRGKFGGYLCYTNSEKILLDDDLQKCIDKSGQIKLSANMLACYLITKCYEKLNYSKQPKAKILRKFRQEIERAIAVDKMKQTQPILFNLLYCTYKKFNPPAFDKPLPSSAFKNLLSNTKLNNAKKSLCDITINFFNNKNTSNTKCVEDSDENKQINLSEEKILI